MGLFMCLLKGFLGYADRNVRFNCPGQLINATAPPPEPMSHTFALTNCRCFTIVSARKTTHAQCHVRTEKRSTHSYTHSYKHMRKYTRTHTHINTHTHKHARTCTYTQTRKRREGAPRSSSSSSREHASSSPCLVEVPLWEAGCTKTLSSFPAPTLDPLSSNP